MTGHEARAFDGRSIIVTGAAGGIGRATAERLAAQGAIVTVVDIQLSGETVARDISEKGQAAHFFQADLTNEADVEGLVASVIAKVGHLDGAVNNAGTLQQSVPVADLPTDEWLRVMNVNLNSIYLCMKHQIPRLLDRGGGSIVNTSSCLGEVAVPNMAAYVASKHGVIGLTRAAATEYSAKGIRFNSVLPGSTKTPMRAHLRGTGGRTEAHAAIQSQRPLGRTGVPDEIASAIAFLLSDASSYMTGAAIPVDGGYLAV